MTSATWALWALAFAISVLAVVIACVGYTWATTSHLDCLTDEDIRRAVDSTLFDWPVLDADPETDCGEDQAA